MKGEPSRSSLVVRSVPVGFEDARRERFMTQVIRLWQDVTGCTTDEIVVTALDGPLPPLWAGRGTRMPFYHCSVSTGLTPYERRSQIAKEVTRIHCEITQALPLLVHTFFGEDREGRLPPGKRAFLLGSIRAGRTPEQKQRLASEMTSALASALGIPPAEVAVVTIDVPARWVMEGGEILPEPGGEAAWISKRA